jgi:hypothetical protein
MRGRARSRSQRRFRSTDVNQCRSGTFTLPHGRAGYAVASEVAADVADDGQGERPLPRTADKVVWLLNQ